jgi:hypothetical protein
MKTNLALIVFASILSVEIAMRFILGFPTKLSFEKWFNEVDKLELINKGIVADSSGMMHFSVKRYQSLKDSLSDYKCTSYFIARKQNSSDLCTFELSKIINNHRKGRNIFFEKFDLSNDSCFCKIISDYLDNPINAYGFYSIDFQKECPNRKKILLIGDSYTLGHSANNFLNSFSNHLLKKGYLVYNAGFSGGDPTQYKLVAKNLIPIVKPDIIIVNFFAGNDIQYFKRIALPYTPLYFNTNAGDIVSSINGVSFTKPDEVYEIIRNFHYGNIGLISKFLIKNSAIYSLVYEKLLYKPNYKSLPIVEINDFPFSNSELLEIKKISDQENIEFVLSVIPNLIDNKIDYKNLGFENLIDHHIFNAQKSHYNLDDIHFNDLGHYLYANYLDSIIKIRINEKK